jgi:hypothetical protein
MRSLPTVFAITFIIFFSSCGESYEFVGKQIVRVSKENMHEDSLIYDSIGKFYFSRLSKPATMGILGNMTLPKENQDQPLWVIFEGRFRTNFPYSHATITVMGTNDKKETLCWNSCYLRLHITDLNQWCHFKDSVFLTSQLNFHIYNSINTFAYLGPSPGEKFDIDSFTVTVRQKISNI